MDMMTWAKNEMDIAKKRERDGKPEEEWDYGCACYDSALKAFESLCGDGHSGMSIQITKSILNRLIDGKVLSPIEDSDDIWERRFTRENGNTVYQNKRMSAFFKDVSKDGEASYSDINRCYCISNENPDATWHNGFVTGIYNEMFPISMPYMPANKPDRIVCGECLSDPKNGDFDTIAIFYIQRANGERVEVNRYFKEYEDSFKEISLEEYKEREKLDRLRREKVINE